MSGWGLVRVALAALVGSGWLGVEVFIRRRQVATGVHHLVAR